jgi:thiol-disulfide isomerase/thioredoxin
MKKSNVQVVKSVIFRLIVFLSLFMTQCQNITPKDNLSIVRRASSEISKITGYVHNRYFYPNTKDITILISHTSGEDRVSQIITPINDDGTFYFEIDLPRPQDVRMEPYLDFLYLVPGDSLHIEIDFRNLDVRLLGGKSVEINNDFQKYFSATGYRISRSYPGVGTDCEKNCSWTEIIEELDKQRNHFREKRNSFLQKNSVHDQVLFLTEAMIELDYYQPLINTWLGRRIHYGKETMDNEALIDELNDVAVRYFNSDFYSNSHFKFISWYIAAARFVLLPSPEPSFMLKPQENFVEWAKEVAHTDIIKDFILTVHAGKALLQRNLDEFYEFSSHINHEYLLDRLMQEYRAVRANMENPEIISSFILGNPRDFAGNNVLGNNNLLADIIFPNYGKVHVINICARWCGPCWPVVEQLATLMEEYASKNVYFTFISVSGDTEEVREMYRVRGIDDTKVYFPNKDESRFLATTFAPMGFPYGLLVNRKGVIVDYGSHVRPEQMLREKINLLLEQDKLVK